jgi:probable rRNA maturation factor
MVEINNLSKSKIPVKIIKKIVEKFLNINNLKNKDVSIAFVGDARIRKLNKQYRQKDQTTDILSFAGEGEQLGELVINFQQIKRQSKQFSQSINEELIFILVHGLLHLVGHEDSTKKGRLNMERVGVKFIKELSAQGGPA